MVDKSRDSEIINIINNIFSSSSFVVETINESLLVELMKKRGTAIKVHRSKRDTAKDYINWIRNNK